MGVQGEDGTEFGEDDDRKKAAQGHDDDDDTEASFSAHRILHGLVNGRTALLVVVGEHLLLLRQGTHFLSPFAALEYTLAHISDRTLVEHTTMQVVFAFAFGVLANSPMKKIQKQMKTMY